MGWQILPDPRCVCAPIQRASTASRPPFDFRSSPRRSYRTSSRPPDMNNRVLRDLMASQACPRGWGRRFASRERGDEAETRNGPGPQPRPRLYNIVHLRYFSAVCTAYAVSATSGTYLFRLRGVVGCAADHEVRRAVGGCCRRCVSTVLRLLPTSLSTTP